MGPLLGRHAQPGNDLFDPFGIGKVVVKFQVVGRPPAVYLRLRTGPEEARAAHTLFLRQYPERRAPVPTAVETGGRIVLRISLFAHRIIKVVGHDAVVFRKEPGDQRVVVGKGQRGIGRDHSLARDGTLRGQCQQMFGAVFFGVVVAKTVERDHHHVGLGLLGRRIRPMVDGNDRRKVLGGQTKRQEKG